MGKKLPVSASLLAQSLTIQNSFPSSSSKDSGYNLSWKTKYELRIVGIKLFELNFNVHRITIFYNCRKKGVKIEIKRPPLLTYNWHRNQFSEHAEDDSQHIILSDAGAISVTYGQLQLCPHLTLSHPGDGALSAHSQSDRKR